VSIGQTLSAARVAAGLSIDDVSAKSRLRATVIRAIEDDDFAPCGGDFYARGHIRTFASIVGADPAALVAEYDATVAVVEDAPLSGQLIDSGASGGSIGRKADRRAPRWGATAAGAALVLIIVVVSVQLAGKHKNTPAAQAGTAPISSPSPSVTPSITPAPVASTPVTQPSTTPVTSPIASPPTSAVADAGVQIVLKVTTSKCWVLASSSDGAELYQGILNPGESKTFADPQKISLKLGNAPATDLTVNGVDIGPPPSKGSVTSISFGPGDPTQAQG
jgi:cytoskeleton protein RodZ